MSFFAETVAHVQNIPNIDLVGGVFVGLHITGTCLFVIVNRFMSYLWQYLVQNTFTVNIKNKISLIGTSVTTVSSSVPSIYIYTMAKNVSIL